ncbi:uncharacterized protein LOC126381417 [Pectinophora gossypiella]|uniref:uncharacterized protein LOC126381417 n=1 Tax=Pectinophora gossypiella TaxID=13191 RepID=UPI00214F2101|nr:uncharacterized protein LOC126381417 [Pectinophora gossypiella]
MRGPYKIVKALPSGRYEMKLLTGSYGKTTQAAAEYLVLWKGEWCPESCASFFENTEEVNDPSPGPSSASGPATSQRAGDDDMMASGASTAPSGAAGLSMPDLNDWTEVQGDHAKKGVVGDDARSGEAVL